MQLENPNKPLPASLPAVLDLIVQDNREEFNFSDFESKGPDSRVVASLSVWAEETTG